MNRKVVVTTTNRITKVEVVEAKEGDSIIIIIIIIIEIFINL